MVKLDSSWYTKRKRIKNKFYKFINPFSKIINELNQNNILDIHDKKDNEPINILKNKEKSNKILKTIQSLDEKYKMPIILCDLDNLSNKEEANIWKISETTIKIRLFRARLKLKTY